MILEVVVSVIAFTLPGISIALSIFALVTFNRERKKIDGNEF